MLRWQRQHSTQRKQTSNRAGRSKDSRKTKEACHGHSETTNRQESQQILSKRHIINLQINEVPTFMMDDKITVIDLGPF